MKLTKKQLKGSTASVKLTEENAFLHAVIRIKLADGHELSPITAQAHKPDSESSRKEPGNSWKTFPGYTGFYALQSRAEIRFHSYGYEEREENKLRELFALARKECEAKNLSYVYPECDLSQFLKALESLGVQLPGYGEVTVNGKEFTQWRQSKRIPQIEYKEEFPF